MPDWIAVPLTNKSDRVAYVDKEWAEDVLCQTWQFANTGYAQTTRKDDFLGRQILLHELIMGHKPGFQVDHIDGNKLNNCEANLRHVTRGQNVTNRGTRTDNSSGHTGVGFSSDYGWRALISVDRKVIHLGWFPTREEAIAARKEAEKKYYGEYAKK